MTHRSPTPRSARAPRALGLPRLALVLGALVAGAGAPGRPAAAGAPEGAALSQPNVPARGMQAVDLQVRVPGRYALFATSKQGTALELVDRAAGPLAADGYAGERNGRVDTWLGAGEYRLRLRSLPDGEGEARVEARPYEERNPSLNLPFGAVVELLRKISPHSFASFAFCASLRTFSASALFVITIADTRRRSGSLYRSTFAS